MKKFTKLLAMLLTVAVLLSASVLATENTAVSNDMMTVTPELESDTGRTVDLKLDTTYEEKVTVTVTSESLSADDPNGYVVLMVVADEDGNYSIEKDTILFIDQKLATDAGSGKGTIYFDVFPSTLKSSVILIVGADGTLKVAIVEGKAVLGDVDGDKDVDTDDLVLLARYLVGDVPVKDIVEYSANVDKIEDVTTDDLVLLARVLVGDTKLD